ncbi:MAG: alpha/beta fold hydrolase [Ilumatobacteraceae bacterium]
MTDSTDVTDSTDPDSGSLTWSTCSEDDVPPAPEGLPTPVPECSTLSVPLDYDEPDGEQIELALIRFGATGDREGAVLTNPGGPGGSGLEFIASGGSSLVTELGLSGFDLVGFDPRGVDRSGGLDCVDDAWLDEHTNPDYTPDDQREKQLLEEARAGVYAACKAEYGASLVHYSTANTARDMGAIREALGDEQVSYLGISYGTYLGAVYATLFPERVRAMVLDSSYEPVDDTVEQQYTTQLVGFEGAFDNWAQWCADDADRCLFSDGDADAVAA